MGRCVSLNQVYIKISIGFVEKLYNFIEKGASQILVARGFFKKFADKSILNRTTLFEEHLEGCSS